jgi:hypothetical protein
MDRHGTISLFAGLEVATGELIFALITQRAIKKGSFSSVRAAGFRAEIKTDRQDQAIICRLQ